MSLDSNKPERSGVSDDVTADEIDATGDLPVSQGDTSDLVLPLDETNDELQPGDRIGRYEYVRTLGKGGFGYVVEAIDPQLNRTVALKFPHREQFKKHEISFLEEARSVARLDHRSIIRIYNVERCDDGFPFVVMEFVKGPTLAEVIRDEGLTYSQAVRYFLQLAQALEYAHRQTLIHRDIKPANVIISRQEDVAKLADFGMALHDLTPEENLADCPQGTPPYMSPEQLRGENHRLDRRTDIWGFGVLMYVVLTGRKPFVGKDLRELVQAIFQIDPKPPSEINGEVPDELDRICMRCLEKLMRDRYQDTGELVADLRAFEKSSRWSNDESLSSSRLQWSDTNTLDQPKRSSTNRSIGNTRAETSSTGSIKTVRVVPKGLRSFDDQDVDFFLHLLPGPKDRLGIPGSIRFWMNQLDPEASDPLTVGMIYGPSGCGKSSFVKAGLIPNLDKSIRTIYLEATPEHTETDLLARIQAIAPNVVRGETDLPIVLSRIRRGQLMTGEKVLIVIDQFEQWLSAKTELDRQSLVQSLRQCDGQQLSCLLLIRDDFWMSASQFMNSLDLRVQEGNNALGIPLFDRKHARNVLIGYGRALQALPEYGQPLDASQTKFIEQSIGQMADQGKIVPIHIAMFAQMLDPDSWRLSELRRQGGWQGIGIRFLNKIFSDKRLANSASICRGLLAKLLPDSDSEIKGTEKSLTDLIPVDANEKNKSQLLRVLDLLDREFRIITPTEVDAEERHYQLAHDSLVIPIRTWLAQKEAETWQGRSRARIGPLIQQWNDRPENRFLPSLMELIPIKLGVKRSSLTDDEQGYLAAATRYYAVRGLLVAAVVSLILLMVNLFSYESQRNRAAEQFGHLLRSNAGEVDARLQLLEPFSERIRNQVFESETKGKLTGREQFHSLLALAHFADVPDEFPLEELTSRIETLEDDEFGNLIRILQSHRLGKEYDSQIRQRLDSQFRSAQSTGERIRCALICLHLIGPGNAEALTRFDQDPELREEFIEVYSRCHGPLNDVVELVIHSADEAFVSALCKSLGQMDSSQMDAATFRRLTEVLRTVYQNSDSPVVHSSAEWAMRNLEIQIPPTDRKSRSGRWFVEQLSGGHQLTFLRVDPHRVFVESVSEQQPSPRQQSLDRGFFVSSKEVSVKLFHRFFEETLSKRWNTAYPASGITSLSCLYWPSGSIRYFREDRLIQLNKENLPICDVTWDEAIEFCNWLSVKQGKRPSYVKNSKTGQWQPARIREGYRLPTNLEFDALNRAGTSSTYFFGNSLKRAPLYACAGTPDLPFREVYVDYRGKRMPNNFGVFDSTGNAAEWSETRNEADGYFFFVRGGATIYPIYYLESSKGISNDAIRARVDAGIRLILDLPKSQ